MPVLWQACWNVIDDDEKGREAREVAATRIQAITRGNRFRKNHALGKAAKINNPRRRPRDEREPQHVLENADDGGRNSAANSTGNGTVSEGPGGAPSTVNGSADVSGGAQGTSAGTASAAGGGGGGEEAVEVDKKTVTLIASLVDERITVREGNLLVRALSAL